MSEETRIVSRTDAVFSKVLAGGEHRRPFPAVETLPTWLEQMTKRSPFRINRFGRRDLRWSVTLGVFGYIGGYLALAILSLLGFWAIENSRTIVLRASGGENVQLRPTPIVEEVEAAYWIEEVVLPAFLGFGGSWIISRFVWFRTLHLVSATVILILLRLSLDSSLLYNGVRPWLGIILFFLCGHGVVGIRPPQKFNREAEGTEQSA